MLVKETCTLAVIQVSVGGRIRGEPGAARAFCGIDYSLLSRCTSRVKSTPLHPPPSLSHLLFPIQRSPPTPLPPSISFLPSSYFFFLLLLSTLLPRFATPLLLLLPPHHRHFLLAYFFPQQAGSPVSQAE